MKQLTDLDLRRTTISKGSFDYLTNLKRLRRIKFCGDLSNSTIESFLEAQPPGCELVQLTPEAPDLGGKRYQIEDGKLLAEEWPQEITKLSGP